MAALLSADAVRDRCNQVFATAETRDHFRINLDRLDFAADYVIETIRNNYPNLDVPFHARWRHFTFAGVDRWKKIADTLDVNREEMARIRFDLVVTSVLLDAGAGAQWRYRDYRTDETFHRSEGLALASLEAFCDGVFSSIISQPLLADADGLRNLTTDHMGAAFQVTADNPLAGLAGRTSLMTALGATLHDNASYFPGDTPRVGNLFDRIVQDHDGRISAPALLTIVLNAFGNIWPGRIEVAGVNLGDTWRHAAIVRDDETTGLVPFHKLSQWLTYSLIEPLQDAGVAVTDIDGLTGLAEYRNGGLFVDLGVLDVCDPTMLERPHNPGDPLIVEWRAMTVVLLDRIAVTIREKLERTAADLPLASILEGGTWAAGRRIAAAKRADAAPPIQIISDGSVF